MNLKSRSGRNSSKPEPRLRPPLWPCHTACPPSSHKSKSPPSADSRSGSRVGTSPVARAARPRLLAALLRCSSIFSWDVGPRPPGEASSTTAHLDRSAISGEFLVVPVQHHRLNRNTTFGRIGPPTLMRWRTRRASEPPPRLQPAPGCTLLATSPQRLRLRDLDPPEYRYYAPGRRASQRRHCASNIFTFSGFHLMLSEGAGYSTTATSRANKMLYYENLGAALRALVAPTTSAALRKRARA